MHSCNARVEMVISNGSSDCHAVYDIAICGKDLIFSDVKAKVVRKMSSFDKCVEIISGKLGEEGVSDGAAGKHRQPTSLCTELKTVFACDTAAKMIKMIVNSDELVQYLQKLELLLIA